MSTSFHASDIRCRLALAEDYEAVMDINRHVYHGWDYLPARYQVYLHDPHALMVLAEVQGRVVAFRIIVVTNDGTTAHGMAGRTHPDYEGHGVFGALVKYSHDMVLARFPRVTQGTYTALWGPEYERLFADPKTTAKLTNTWNALLYPSTGTKVLNWLNSQPSSDSILTALHRTSLPTKAQTYEILTRPENQRHLFCGNPILQGTDWIPRHPTNSTMRNIIQSNRVVITNSADENIPCQAVSFYYGSSAPAGARLDFWFYGSSANDLVAHVVRQLRLIEQQLGSYKSCIVSLYFPKRVNVNVVKDICVPTIAKATLWPDTDTALLITIDISKQPAPKL